MAGEGQICKLLNVPTGQAAARQALNSTGDLTFKNARANKGGIVESGAGIPWESVQM